MSPDPEGTRTSSAHYAADSLGAVTSDKAMERLAACANDWWARGYRVAHMAQRNNQIVLLLEHIDCNCLDGDSSA